MGWGGAFCCVGGGWEGEGEKIEEQGTNQDFEGFQAGCSDCVRKSAVVRGLENVLLILYRFYKVILLDTIFVTNTRFTNSLSRSALFSRASFWRHQNVFGVTRIFNIYI